MIKTEIKLRTGIREEAPCRDCPERFLACSDHCPKDERGEFGYKAWKATIKEINEKRNAYYNEKYNKRKGKMWQ